MPAIAFQFSALGSQTWTPTRPVTIRGFQSFGGAVRAILSYDPAATVAAFSTPSANGVDKNIIMTAGPTDGMPVNQMFIPVSAGEAILVAVSAAGTAVIHYDETITET